MTSATVAKTIIITGHCLQKEGIAGATITPGMLVERNANAEVIPHASDGASAQPAFAVEYDMTGRGIDDNYASGDQVIYKVAYEGSEINALIADGESIAYDDPLTSNGDGSLREAGAGDHVVALARAAATPSGSTARCIVEVTSGYVLTT